MISEDVLLINRNKPCCFLYFYLRDMQMTEGLRSDGDSSVGLEPVQISGDPGEDLGCAGLAACRCAEGDNSYLGGKAVGLGDDQGAAGVAVAGGVGTTVGVNAQHVGGNAGSKVLSALRVGNNAQVSELEDVADSWVGCYQDYIKLNHLFSFWLQRFYISDEIWDFL
jgi:hypothetical protein